MSSLDSVDAIREALQGIQRRTADSTNRWCSPLTSEYLNDMEKRYTRGRSEERYPSYYRGRSASPVRQTERCRSVEPDVYTYERTTKPVYKQTTSTEPSYPRSEMRSELMKPYSDFYYYRPYTDRYYSVTRPYYYNYSSYDPYYYYTPRAHQYSYSYHYPSYSYPYYSSPSYSYYNYYRPYYHYRPSRYTFSY